MRRKRDPAKRRTERVQVSMTPDQRAVFEARAIETDESLSAAILSIALDGLKGKVTA